jgi:elongation factor G
MLFLAGEGRHQGSVDDGDTVTDFLEQERERGITIQSAAVSLRWAGHNITLIDTPGHVDFGVEVERALRVMDGVVVVIDAVAGVQAQTEAVWRTAQAQGIPAMAFINKLDRQGADMHGAMASVQHRLGIFPLPIHMPLGSSQGSEYGLCGLVDLVSMEPLIYSTGVRGGAVNSANRDSVVLERPGWDAACATLEPGARDSAEEWRGKLLANLAEVDDTFMEMYLLRGEGDGSYSTDEILVALRRACFSRAGIPVACGAALRGVGVESLLDCVLTFLPGPLER